MNNSKPWYQSKTIIGGIINALVLVSYVSGLKISEEIIGELINGVAGVIGTVMVIIGRIKAQGGIK